MNYDSCVAWCFLILSVQQVSSPPSCESDTSSRSESQRSSLIVSEHLPQSVASEQVFSLVSEHLPSLVTSRTVDSVHSSLHSIQEALSNKGILEALVSVLIMFCFFFPLAVYSFI